jgi:2-amino-4-hydroxy-6-hydroxymethyldihydropteridine diphosphokinase
MDSIRIKFCENVDHFIESQQQMPPSPPLMSEKNQRIFFAILIGGTLIYAFAEQYYHGTRLNIILPAALFCVAIMAFWVWFFKKIGLYKTGPPAPYQWTEKDRARFHKAYVKQTGRSETNVVGEFNERGFSLGPENEKPGVHEWTAIVKVVECPRGLLVYIRASTCFWFPQRAFASVGAYQDLIKLVALKVPQFQRLNLAIIALGSNLGKSREAITTAMTHLESCSDAPVLKSSIWQTTPVDCPPGSPPFLNAVVGLLFQKDETPVTLLEKMQAMEKTFGRAPKKILNEPRPLDLDLITFGNEAYTGPDLVLPHPRAHQRRFVLQPLSEIAPELILPGQTQTVAQLLAALPPDDGMTRVP